MLVQRSNNIRTANSQFGKTLIVYPMQKNAMTHFGYYNNDKGRSKSKLVMISNMLFYQM